MTKSEKPKPKRERLRPCCGVAPEIDTDQTIWEVACQGECGTRIYDEKRRSVISAWNRRASR